ncbi:hypothetical protein Q5752_002378 [Cryptotrichosporon argae]
MLFQSLLLPVALSASLAAALPASVTQERRSYPSNGLTCYYECPALPDIQALNPGVQSGPYYFSGTVYNGNTAVTAGGCQYNYASYGGVCYYDATTGRLLQSTSLTCPAQVPVATCNTSGAGTAQFKRSLPRERESAGQKLIRSLQYKPAKVSK